MSARSLSDANPRSVIRAADGRIVELKAHRATWSGRYPENSLDGLRECYAERLARVEIDFRLQDDELVVAHDHRSAGDRVPRTTLADALEVVRDAPPGPTLLMLDAKDEEPWVPAIVERIIRLVEPARERILIGTPADWNLRRLRDADQGLILAFDPMYYLEDKESRGPWPPVGAYGYRDAHPLGFQRRIPVADYLRERLAELVRRVPGTRELHVRLALFEQLQEDGVDVVAAVHEAGARIDVWTLDAGSPRWRERLANVLAAGVDIVTTNTPREMAAAGAEAARGGASAAHVDAADRQ